MFCIPASRIRLESTTQKKKQPQGYKKERKKTRIQEHPKNLHENNEIKF